MAIRPQNSDDPRGDPSRGGEKLVDELARQFLLELADVNHLLAAARHRWLTNQELFGLLHTHHTCDYLRESRIIPDKPASGTLLLYNRRHVNRFRLSRSRENANRSSNSAKLSLKRIESLDLQSLSADASCQLSRTRKFTARPMSRFDTTSFPDSRKQQCGSPLRRNKSLDVALPIDKAAMMKTIDIGPPSDKHLRVPSGSPNGMRLQSRPWVSSFSSFSSSLATEVYIDSTLDWLDLQCGPERDVSSQLGEFTVPAPMRRWESSNMDAAGSSGLSRMDTFQILQLISD